MVEEGRDPRVPRSQGPKVQGSHGPSYLKVTFKYELDSKEGPSCFHLFYVIYDGDLMNEKIVNIVRNQVSTNLGSCD